VRQPLDGHSASRRPPMDYRHKPPRRGVNFGRRSGVNIQRRLTARSVSEDVIEEIGGLRRLASPSGGAGYVEEVYEATYVP
jgi:hypothetical protein